MATKVDMAIGNLRLDKSLDDDTLFTNKELVVLRSKTYGLASAVSSTAEEPVVQQTADVPVDFPDPAEHDVVSGDEGAPISDIAENAVLRAIGKTLPTTVDDKGFATYIFDPKTGEQLPGTINPPKFESTLEVPKGTYESFEYWGLSELLSFDFELALGYRWETLANKAMLDGLSLVKSVGTIANGFSKIAKSTFNIGYGQVGTSSMYSGGTLIFPIANYDQEYWDKQGLWATPVIIEPPYVYGTGIKIPGDTTTINGVSFGSSRPAHAETWPGGGHQGCDWFTIENGEYEIVAPFDGYITRRKTSGSPGNYFHLTSADGLWIVCGMHCFEPIIPGLNDAVEQGQLIGYVGDTGNAKGGTPHLHTQVWDASNGGPTASNLIDPAAFFQGSVIIDSSSNRAIIGNLNPKSGK